MARQSQLQGRIYDCMTAEWMTSPSAQRVLQHAADSRPAWVWTQDGQTLLWKNKASELFLAKLKKQGLRRAPLAVPIKGQVARIIRLGSPDRTSLARIQFLAGEKPVSGTCATTPLPWENEQSALLIVGVDPIDPEILSAAAAAELHAGDTRVTGTDLAEEENRFEPAPEQSPAPPEAQEIGGETNQAFGSKRNDGPAPDPDLLAEAVGVPPQHNDAALTPADGASNRLSRLVDRLAAGETLYEPLVNAPTAAPEIASSEAPRTDATQLYKITGRGFRSATESPPAQAKPEEGEGKTGADLLVPLSEDEEAIVRIASDVVAGSEPADAETVERVSRYNFDELSRILSDRVGDSQNRVRTEVPVATQKSGSLVSLGGETLVLNRLPLGILVFRDQEVLFANRSITEMVGYDSVEMLRTAGLAAIFPATASDGQEAGPVNHLVQRDGTLVPVTARLQSISWQGRPALMLSASTTEVRTSHEEAVRAFARNIAEVREDGFFEATKSGIISAITPRAVALLGKSEAPLTGTALSALLAAGETAALRAFLDRPAKFAEMARPCLTLRSASGKAEIIIFAQGQAGVVSGYFGFVHGRESLPLRLPLQGDIDPALLARVSRGVRRPLNTIIGFSDLIRSDASDKAGNERYEAYAQDIVSAGQEIAALVEELDDYARLRDGRYLPQRASIELTALLEGCVLRTREQANAERVIVRNAISEHLPRITADRASLAQAVLNLLASAIDQSPAGGAVVISAQRTEEGGIAIHVRDSSDTPVDLAERFVVFREGPGKDGRMMAPIRSSVGLALTRALLAVNTISLEVDPAGAQGLLFTLAIPADLVDMATRSGAAE